MTIHFLGSKESSHFYIFALGCFSMLGEASTKEIAVNRNAQGFIANVAVA